LSTPAAQVRLPLRIADELRLSDISVDQERERSLSGEGRKRGPGHGNARSASRLTLAQNSQP
jgi:hypothetical protein